MISLYQLKPSFQKLLRPLVRTLHEWGISPNCITLSAVVLSAAMGGLIYFNGRERFCWLLLPAVLFFRMALNAFDGMMARQYHLTTKRGAILNELGDIVSDICIYLPFVNVVDGSDAAPAPASLTADTRNV